MIKEILTSASRFHRGLPVLRIVKVKLHGKMHIAAVKRYLPCEVNLDKLGRIDHSGSLDYLDYGHDQYHADSRGTIYRVDTQRVLYW